MGCLAYFLPAHRPFSPVRKYVRRRMLRGPASRDRGAAWRSRKLASTDVLSLRGETLGWPGDVGAESPLHQVDDLLDLTRRWSSAEFSVVHPKWKIACLPMRPPPIPLVLMSAPASVPPCSRGTPLTIRRRNPGPSCNAPCPSSSSILWLRLAIVLQDFMGTTRRI